MLCNLLNQIRSQSDCSIVVVNDCSKDLRYETLPELYSNLHLVKTRKNGGKIRYWKTVSDGLKVNKSLPWDYLIFLADDLVLSDNFFEVLRENCKNNRVVNFFNAGFESMWGYREYVDGAFASPRSLWQDLSYKAPPVPRSRWRGKRHLSSGVWWRVTQEINNRGYRVKKLKDSLVDHLGNSDSKMNPEERIKNPLKSKSIVTYDNSKFSNI
jgi:GT2 family glycosyltransferase